ncbi:MAG: hypothetical protein M3422_04130 [Actinomycetota bacterium]|nr:hypothetical protein [Actinomycetota bacterium]
MSMATVSQGGTSTWNRPMLLLAYAMVPATLVALAGLVIDDRVLGGMPIWAKPLKFTLSIGLYAITWSWLASLTTRAPKLVRRMSVAIVWLMVVELVLITGQVIRGRASHFNNETEFDHRIYHAMGVSITLIWLLTLGLTLIVMRSEIHDLAQKWAIRIGTVLSLIGAAFGPVMALPTDAQAAEMRAGLNPAALGSHSVGVPDGGPGLPLVGWSTTGGDLRIPHFLGLHALQALPLLALVLTLLAAQVPLLRSELVRVRLVLVGGAGFTGLLALVSWQAFRGQPLIHPDGWTSAAFCLLVAGVVAGIAWACRAAVADRSGPDAEKALTAADRHETAG